MTLAKALKGPLRVSSRALWVAAIRASDHAMHKHERIDVEAAQKAIEELAYLLSEPGIYDLHDGGGPGLMHIRRSADGELGAWAMYSVRSGLYIVGAISGAVGVASDVFEAADLVPGYGPTSLTAVRWSQEWAEFQSEVQFWRERLYGGEK
ncbi:hypothetical protein [Herbidospora sp. NBRC 101105]|uniref:hypothetical protein n=1 Tax=Herbidospora sp. NBRC 101105 TaxID=3032195 RepID=UPI0024A2C2D2|nr:hypothetical protein [Herbidospora sp. NBRC 101105]GLX95266.1 hypothetical protein Hesp01_32160 [Herbidospora sp. NBRC 101105]